MEGESSTIISFVFLFTGFVALYCFFVVSTASIRRTSSSKLQELQESGSILANQARKILQKGDNYLLKCQLGQLISASSFGWLFFGLFHTVWFESYWNQADLSSNTTQGFSSLILAGIFAILLLAMLTFILIQIAKAIVGAHPERVLCAASIPIIVVCKILAPVAWLVTLVSGKLIDIFKLQRLEERNLIASAQDISEIVLHSSQAGEIDEDERDMIEGVFAFSDTIVPEVMTPRKDIVFVKMTNTLTEIVKIFNNSGFSRLIVCGDDLDDVRGVILAKDFLAFIGSDDSNFSLERLIRPAYFCDFNKKVDDLLQDLRGNAIHLAIVRDEHGGVDGIVTLEDLVEEIVGDIVDEFDIGDDQIRVRLMDGGDLLVDGGLSIFDLNLEYNLDIPEGEYNTLGGFVCHQAGRIPSKGEIITTDKFSIKVEKIYQNRIKLLRIIKGDKPLTKLSVVPVKNPESKKPQNESKQWDKNRDKSALIK